MRIVFLGTPAFAVPTLKKLLSWDKGEVVAVVTQPDRPVGRHLKLQASAVKQLAESAGVPIFQPEKLSKSPEIVEELRALKPDVLVLVVFGQLLKEPVLKLAPHGVVNLHPSLLPKYRGAAPVNCAVINGDTITGVTTMLLDEGMDTGDILLQREVPIGANETSADLFQTLSLAGADLIVETLEGLLAKKITPQSQDNTLATVTSKLTTEIGNIDWSKGAQAVHNLVRGLIPWPGAYSYFNDVRIKFLSTVVPEKAIDFSGHTIPARWAAGLLFTVSGRYFVNCNANTMDLLELVEVQPENATRMSAHSWVNGFGIKDATALGTFSDFVA